MLCLERGCCLNEVPIPPEAPPEAVKPRFGRALYLVIAVVAIAIIAIVSVIVFTQFMPSDNGDGELVPLGLNYSVGEKMTYDISMTTEVMGEEVSLGGTLEMEVLSFDGENYVIQQTMTLDGQESSFTVEMNQMGEVVEYTGLSPEIEETLSSFYSVPGLGSYFTEEEMRVGESWEIPFDFEMMGMDLDGTIGYKLSEITSVMVPAGTYEALKIKIESSGLRATYSMEGMDAHLTVNIEGYTYLEEGTCRLIELSLDTSVTMTSAGQSASMEMTMQMQLIEHLK